MRPYLAILKDSFREALASRVLWVVLAVIVALLLVIAPLGYGTKLAGEFAWGDIQEWPQLVAKLRAAAAADDPSPGKRIWGSIDVETRAALVKASRVNPGKENEYFAGMETLRKALNKLVKSRDLYREGDWQIPSLPKEARDLLARPQSDLSEEEADRLNRVLIESTARGHFRTRSVSTSLTYFGISSYPLPFTKEQIDRFTKEIVLTTAMGWIVGVFGMITAVLVTSTIIPQMFEPGSITLLLSKPVSRSLLFITKFLGGCAFILLNVALLIGGLWLIAGTRFGIWNHGMLWCIPLFLFMFLIYYAVSAFTGVIWKSAVVSVVLTVVFWALCFVLDMFALFTNAISIEPQRIARVVVAEQAVLAVAENGHLLSWDDSARLWRTINEPRGDGIPTIDGPFYHPATRQVLVGQGFRNPFGIVGQRITLRLARADDGWTLRDGPALPSGSAALVVENDGSVLAIAEDDTYRLKGPPAPVGEGISFFGLRVPFTGKSGEFRPALADTGQSFPDPLAAAADPQAPRLVVASGNRVHLLMREDDGLYQQRASATLKGRETEGAALAIAGKLAVVAREEGPVWLLDSANLTTQQELTLETETQPRLVMAAPDSSQFGVLFQNGRLWLIDADTGQARLAPVSGQRQISGFAFSNEQLLVGDYANSVTAYDLATLDRERSYRPALTWQEWMYYYAIRPLHAISPKPRHLGNTVQYLMTGNRTTDLGFFGGNLAQRRNDLHPWRPVASGLAFVGFMLLISCIYLERHEF